MHSTAFLLRTLGTQLRRPLSHFFCVTFFRQTDIFFGGKCFYMQNLFGLFLNTFTSSVLAKSQAFCLQLLVLDWKTTRPDSVRTAKESIPVPNVNYNVVFFSLVSWAGCLRWGQASWPRMLQNYLNLFNLKSSWYSPTEINRKTEALLEHALVSQQSGKLVIASVESAFECSPFFEGILCRLRFRQARFVEREISTLSS